MGNGIAAGLTAAFVAASAASACTEDKVEIRGDFGAAVFTVAVADDPQERGRGLMFVEEMPMMTGMLFIYESPRPASFWMRNTLIPLDMLFADPEGVVTRIHPEAVPLDETPIFGGDNILYVLEINVGMAARLGISEGAQLYHPQITCPEN